MPEDLEASAGRFDIAAIARSLPENAATLLVDKDLTDRKQGERASFPGLSSNPTALSRHLR